MRKRRTSTDGRFVAEGLENRRLLSAGDLGVKGFLAEAETKFAAVAADVDGKILVASNYGTPGPGQPLVIAGLSRYNADGTKDTSFYGQSLTDNSYPRHRYFVFNTVIKQPDGMTLAGGYVVDTATTPAVSDFLLARYDNGGALDWYFGDHGTLVTALPGNEQVTSLAVGANGEIYAEGPYFNAGAVGFHIARYSSAGVLESVASPSLGSNGGQSGAVAMALTNTGAIVVGGALGSKPAVWRFGSSLTPDGSFGVGGVATVTLPAGDVGAVSALGFTSDGHIVAAGADDDYSADFGGKTYFLTRLSGQGVVDTAFGTSGVAKVKIYFTPYRYPLAGLAVQSDGKLVLAGSEQRPGVNGPNLVLRRYLSNGVADTTFRNDADPDFAGTGAGTVASGLGLDNFGRPLIVGSVIDRSILGTGVARYETDVTPPGLSANFSGRPIPVPEYKIEAEDFDRGGEGVGYHDTSSANSGGVYRAGEGVDIAADNSSADKTNGYLVNDTHPGEWLRYTIGVGKSGIYRLRAHASDYWIGGQFHGEVDGVNVTGEMAMAKDFWGSGGYLECESRGFWISAGTHTLRVVMDKAGPTGIVGRFDHFVLDEGGGGPFGPVPFDVTGAGGVLEAENFDFGNAIDTTAQNMGGQYRPFERVDINGGGSNGFSVGYVMKGEQLTYMISSPTNSMYQLQARVACYKPGGTFHVQIDGTNVTGPMVVPDTGPWDTWATITSPAFALTPTRHWMSVIMDQGGYWEDVVGDLDYFRFVKTDQVAPPVVYDQSGALQVTPRYPIQAAEFDSLRDVNGLEYVGEGVTYHDTTPENLGGQWRLGDGVDIIPVTDPQEDAQGYAVGYTAPGEWLRYTISLEQAGNYGLLINVANKGPGGTFHVEMDGVNLTGTLGVPDTGGYHTWQTVSGPRFDVSEGRHVLRLVMDTAGPLGNVGNFAYLQFTPRIANVVDMGYSYSTNLTRSSDGQYVVWSNTEDLGMLRVDDPQGLTINGRAGLLLDYSRGDPLPHTLHLNGNMMVQGFKGLAGMTTVDIGKSTLDFLNEPGSSVAENIRQALRAGYNNGGWDGVATATQGVIRSQYLGSTGIYSLGYNDSADVWVNEHFAKSVRVGYTIGGDADMDGFVGQQDAVILGRNYMSGDWPGWSRGNFNYDASVSYLDALILQKNFNKSIWMP